MSDGVVLRCPACGAPGDPKAGSCAYCGAVLHAVRCPWCFDWTYAETKDCPRCGSSAVPAPADARPLGCPSCRKGALSMRALGGARLSGCAACGGVWADSASFKKLCEDREAQSAYLGPGSALPPPGAVDDPSAHKVVYRPCPVCGELMNRFNFAGSSGVILDACKPHGVWFDADELRRIVLFIRAGGLDAAREREKLELELERERRAHAPPPVPSLPLSMDPTAFRPTSPDAVAAAASLLEHLFGL